MFHYRISKNIQFHIDAKPSTSIVKKIESILTYRFEQYQLKKCPQAACVISHDVHDNLPGMYASGTWRALLYDPFIHLHHHHILLTYISTQPLTLQKNNFVKDNCPLIK